MAIVIIRNFELMSDRYKYDFRRCTYAKGWAQVDTKQDASYYGTWTNPEQREIFNYCEGDLTLTHCDTDTEYCAEVRRCADWNRDAGYWLGIDPGFGAEMKAKFEALGLAELLH